MDIEKLIDAVIDRKGAIATTRPSGAGGGTRWGVTQAVAPMAIAAICASPPQQGS